MQCSSSEGEHDEKMLNIGLPNAVSGAIHEVRHYCLSPSVNAKQRHTCSLIVKGKKLPR